MTREEYIANIAKLNYYTKKYDEGNPEISDEQWDALYFDCCAYEEETGFIDPKSPSATIQYSVTNSLKKVTHSHPMLSLDKTKDINALLKWIGNNLVVAMLKMDGLTCSLTYEDGKLVLAETRGNGTIGEDITENAMTLPSIPKKISRKGRVVVDGEVICKYDDFEEFADSFKNPRNFAAGSIRLMDSAECAKRKLTFVAWDMPESDEDFLTKLETLEKLKFTVVEYVVVDLCDPSELHSKLKELEVNKSNLDRLEALQSELKALAASKKYPIDGLVFRINDGKLWKSMGKTEHAFQGSLAFKFYDQLYETELLDIVWSTGKSGAITPIANFKPVIIDGTTVQNASMHNLTIMKNLLGDNPHVGQKLWVFKANQIIPQIARAEKNN